jgi:putative intracellular protease/amidase
MLDIRFGRCSIAGNGGSYVKQNDLVITGQNPASSEEVAKLLLAAIEKKDTK